MAEKAAAAAVRAPIAFEEIAVYFRQVEWEDTEEWKKDLYRETMKENYETLTSLAGHGIIKNENKIRSKELSRMKELHDMFPGEDKKMFAHASIVENESRSNQERKSPIQHHRTPDWTESSVPQTSHYTEGGEGSSKKAEVLIENENLLSHETTHTGEGYFTYTETNGSVHHELHLVVHQTVNMEPKPFKCPECGKCFGQKSNLRVHERSHKGEITLTCTVCDKSFSRKSNLREHQRIHTGENIFICTECGKSFSRTSNLRVHQRIHTGEHKFICTECGKNFSRKSSLKVHQSTHSGEKPFTCNECQKSFSRKSSLMRHQTVHTEES